MRCLLILQENLNMMRKLIYVLIASCISLIAVHDAHEISAGHNQEKITSISNFYISEVSHEQSPARPSNINVPSPVRTIQANRTKTITRFQSFCNETIQKSLFSFICENKAHLLPLGFTDLSDHFISLCRLVI